MIDVTPGAVEQKKKIIQDEDAEGSSIRVVLVAAGHGVQYMLTLENESKEDDVVAHEDGVRVIVDADSAPLMEGAQIDYVEDLMRSGFAISNPNIQSAGGCGSGGCGCGSGGCGSGGGGCGCGAGH